MPLDQFETEFELKEIDDDTALLPMALILRTTPTGEDAIEPAFSLHDVAQRTRGKNLYGGMDVGRIKDAGELTIFVEEDDGRLYEIYTRTFIDTPFDIQEEHCHEALMLPNLMRFVIDATGMGQPMGESLEKRWGHRAMPLKFSGPQVSSLATMQKMYMEKDKVVYLWDQDRNAQMHAVKKHISHSGHRVSFGAPRGKGGTGRRHHGDVFWSRAMGIWGHADLKSYGKPRVRFL
jgi:phage FluMu gp28-like protein